MSEQEQAELLEELGRDKTSEMTQQQIKPLEIIEGEINFYKQQTAIGIMEIGKRLIEAKEQLPHGEWGKWLKEKVEFSDRTARRFMQCSSEFSNSSTLRNLGQTKLFALLDVPLDDREEFMSTSHEVNGETKTVDEMTSRELQQAIKERSWGFRKRKTAFSEFLIWKIYASSKNLKSMGRVIIISLVPIIV